MHPDIEFKMQTNNIQITKASGETEAFDVKKLESSLQKAGTSEELVSKISKQVSDWIVPGISTKEIYTHAFSLLKQEESVSHIRYNLKKAFLDLGTTGYPFEKIIGELFRRQGYTCQTGITVQGCCITHEMDVIATKDKTQFLMECKYRQEQGKTISIQTPLYVHSRVNDIIEQNKKSAEYKDFTFQAWVVTNTRFSKDSETYGNCKGLKLLGWDYPLGEGLKDLVEKYQLYPVSILTSLAPETIQKCFDEGMVTCEQLYENSKFIHSLDISESDQKCVYKELSSLLNR